MTSYSFIVIAVIVSTIAWVLWSYNTLGDKDEWIFNFLKLLEYIQRYQSIFALILSLAIIVPTGLVMYRLSWRGTSMELKNKVCRRQLIYFFLFLIYLFDVMHEYFLYDVFSDQVQLLNIPKWVEFCFDFYRDFLGVPLALIRLFEPYVFHEFKRQVAKFCKGLSNKCCCCCRQRSRDQSNAQSILNKITKKRAKNKYNEEPLCAFLNQSISIEFVSIILLGVNNFMDIQKKFQQRGLEDSFAPSETTMKQPK